MKRGPKQHRVDPNVDPVRGTKQMVGDVIRDLRRERGLSQSNFAKIAGIGARTLSDLENGTPGVHLNLRTLQAAGDALGLSAWELLMKIEPPKGSQKASRFSTDFQRQHTGTVDGGSAHGGRRRRLCGVSAALQLLKEALTRFSFAGERSPALATASTGEATAICASEGGLRFLQSGVLA